MQRLQLNLTGQIQGVGFRPRVYHIAKQLGLTGSVYNSANGVTIEIQGIRHQEFLTILQQDLPNTAKLETTEKKLLEVHPTEQEFYPRQ